MYVVANDYNCELVEKSFATYSIVCKLHVSVKATKTASRKATMMSSNQEKAPFLKCINNTDESEHVIDCDTA